ncbi:hypothetical protein D3C76_1677010 [compost metagenome]
MVLYHVVGFWNGFFDALIYLNDESKYPLQLVLRTIPETDNMIQHHYSQDGLGQR